jgi:hypothetical protein
VLVDAATWLRVRQLFSLWFIAGELNRKKDLHLLIK